MTDDSHRACILGLATSVPEYSGCQETAARFASRVLEASVASRPRRERALEMVRKIYSGSGIENRNSVVGDFACDDPRDFEFFPGNWQLEPFPSTARRMKLYELTSVELALRTSRRALEEAEIAPEQVTHLVVSTCTGLFAPGPDILLQRRLGLRPDLQRTIIGFMGCHAGLIGLRTADQIIRGQPEALVLLLALEICTIHFQKRPTPSSILSNGLFSDGCAALVCGSDRLSGARLFDVLGTRSLVDGDSLDQMSWRVGDHGFEMHLAAAIPETLGSCAPAFVRDLLRPTEVTRAEVAGWAIHPGGRKILEAAGEALGLKGSDLASSHEVLRSFGNMSSPTVFFVLRRLLDHASSNGPVVALGFGPGLTLEGALLRSRRT